jgi:hypothetical protein
MLDDEHVILGVFGLHEIAPFISAFTTPSRCFFFDFFVYLEATALDYQTIAHAPGGHSDYIKSSLHWGLKKDWRETEELRPGS